MRADKHGLRRNPEFSHEAKDDQKWGEMMGDKIPPLCSDQRGYESIALRDLMNQLGEDAKINTLLT
jgi:hypothetical protein